jgi:YHS domain-containing protein
MVDASTRRWYAAPLDVGRGVLDDGGYPRSNGSHEESMMAIEIDPVCGMQVDTSTSLLSLEHDGTTYWFCSKGCMLEFRDDPEKYLAPDYKPSM